MDEKRKIIVCVKVVADPSVLNFDLDTGSFDPDDLIYMVNPADLAALETALDLRDRLGPAEVICISMAPPIMAKHLRSCLARGADRAVILWHDRFEGSDGMAVAGILAAAIKKIGFDLVLTGNAAIDHGNGIVGPALASVLDLPHVSAITRLEISDGMEAATVHRALERGEREVLECKLPALFTVHQTMNVPRRPNFPSSLAALEKEVPRWGMEELGLNEAQVGRHSSAIKILGLSLPRPRPRVTMRMDSSLHPVERMRLLVSGGIGEKKGEILTGEPSELARKVINIILEKSRTATGDQPAE